MDQSRFLSDLAEILQIDAIRSDQPLTDGAWDSVAIMSTIALADEQCDVVLSASQLSQCTTPQDIFDLIARATPA